MSKEMLLSVINSGDIASLLDLIGEDRSLDLNATYSWDAKNTCSPFQTPQNLPSPFNSRPPLSIPSETYHCTPINLATLNGNKSMVRVLLQNGADPNKEDSRKRNALICALYGIDTLKMQTDTFSYLSVALPEYLDLIRILIPHMVIASMNRPLESLRGTSILCFACYLGKVEAVKLLLSSEHISVNAADCKGATALMYAVREGHLNIIKELVRNKAKPELTNQEGFSAIQYARNSSSITHELERALSLERSRSLDPTQFSSPIASFKVELDLILAEDDFQASQDTPEASKSEPAIGESHQKFLGQVQRGEIESVQMQLIEYLRIPHQSQVASLVNFHDRVTGLTPMHKAICNGNDASLAMIESLYLAGSDLNSASWSGRTPLHHLCILASQPSASNSHGSVQDSGNLFSVLASRMVDLGASLTVVDKKGKTPLHYAVRGEESVLPLVGILLSRGADPLALDLSKRSPMISAENPAIIAGLKEFLRAHTPGSETPIPPPPSRRRPEVSMSFSRPVSAAPSELHFDVKSVSSSRTAPPLGDTVQDFLDQYRIFDSTIALECLPSIREIKALISSRVIAGGVRHQFNLTGIQNVADFENLLHTASSRADTASQRYSLLSEKQEAVIEDFHSRYRSLTQSRDSLVTSWRQGADSLPQLKQDLRTLATRISNFKSECNFLVKAFTNKRITFLGEFQRQMSAQKCSVVDNNTALTNLVAEELLDFNSLVGLEDRRASSESGSSSSSRDSSELDSLELKLRSLTSNSKDTQLEMNRTKAKLSELRDQKSILFSAFTAQFSVGASFHQEADSLTIPLSDLATQAEMLTNQHERLLAKLERHIDQNERQMMEIGEVRSAMYKQSNGCEWGTIVSSPTEMRPGLLRSTSVSSPLNSPEMCPPSHKLIDVMMQIQAIDLALFSLKTWIPYKLDGVRSILNALETTLDKLLAKVEEVGSDVAWAEQFTVQLRQAITNRESSLCEMVRSREAWLTRARLGIVEARSVNDNGLGSHSLKHWQWDFEGAFRDCQITNLEESCLELASDMDSHHAHLASTTSKTTGFLAQLRFQEQYLRTKLHSADPTKPGAFHELQQLEAYLDKIKSRDSSIQSNPSRGVHRRSSSLFSTPDLVPSSPTTTSLSSTSFESGYDSILSFHRRKLSEDLAFGEPRPSLPRAPPTDRASRRISDDAYSGRGSLFKTAIPEEIHLPKSMASLRRSTSTLGLNIKPRPLSNHSVSSATSSPQLRPLRNSGSMATFSRSTRTPTRVSALARISTHSTQSVTSFSLSPSNSTGPTKPAPRQTLRRIASEIHPGAKQFIPHDSAISSPTTSEPSSTDRLVGLLAGARREVEVLEKLVPAGILPPDASELDARRHALLIKKRAQIRQLSLALQKMGRTPGGSPLTNIAIPQLRVGERRPL